MSKQQQRLSEHKKDAEAAIVLQRVYLGDYFAENEQDDLLDYFILTAQYQEALRANQSMIYAGRKGSGKTANLYKLADELRSDKRNHVCIIKPVDYDVEGVLNLLQLSLPRAEQGYLIESLWKFLIYTQLATSLYDQIASLPQYIALSDEQQDFLLFVEANSDFLQPDFTIRMENAITRLCQINITFPPGAQRAKVSEILHSDLLAELRKYLGILLEGKNKVCVLVDNLDKAWILSDRLRTLSDFIFGLLSVGRAIEEEFKRIGSSWRRVNLSVLIFLRSDIFSYVMSEAREVDKLPFSRLVWNDARLLQRIIEERFVNSLEGQVAPEDVWSRFFLDRVRETPTSDYITNAVLPRPRDIIYFCKASLANSINRRHTRIEEEDVLLAENDYSHYAYLTLVAETKPYFSGIENVIIEFVGADKIVTRAQVGSFVKKAGLDPAITDQVIDLLSDALFLGLEVGECDFRFMYDENKKSVFKSLSRLYAERVGEERFLINPPFHAYLEIGRS